MLPDFSPEPDVAAPPAFDYSILGATGPWLRTVAADVRHIAYRTSCDMIRVGRLLIEARGRVKSRTFKRWIAAELPWSRSHAYRLMGVADVFGPLLAVGAEEKVEPTALYLLSQPAVPPEARAYAVELSTDRKVTAADAREILAAHRQQPELTPKETRSLAPLREEDKAAPTEPDLVPLAEAWGYLIELAQRCTIIHIGRIEEDEDSPLYSVTVYAEDDHPHNHVRRTLTDAIAAAAGKERVKWCPGCEKEIAVGLFGANELMPDGLAARCKACERSRISAIKKRKKQNPPT